MLVQNRLVLVVGLALIETVQGNVNSSFFFSVPQVSQDLQDYPIHPMSDEQEDSSVLQEFDDSFEQEIVHILQPEAVVILPEYIKPEEILSAVKFQSPVTPDQKAVNTITTQIDSDKLRKFCHLAYEKLSLFLTQSKVTGTAAIAAKDLTKFVSSVHTYTNSTDYLMNCLSLFENETFTENHKHVCFNISKNIRKLLLDKKAEDLPMPERSLTTRTVATASEAKIRYVAGYCIAKVRHQFVERKRSCRYRTDTEGQCTYKESICAVNILNLLKVEEYTLQSTTTNPESLRDVQRKQNVTRSLTNVTDELFDFFLQFTEKCLRLLTNENVNKSGSKIFEFVKDELLADNDLYLLFLSVVKKSDQLMQFDENADDCQIKEEPIHDVYLKIVKTFLMVMINQFRKDILESLDVAKKMAHRKAVQVSTTSKRKGSGDSNPRKSARQEEQDSPTPGTSNLRQGTSLDNPTPGTSTLGQATSQDNPTPGTSTSGQGTLDSSVCAVCFQGEKPGDPDWIQCTECEHWCHRKCAGLGHHMKWRAINKPGAKYLCTHCK